jgi:hypothetical protein
MSIPASAFVNVIPSVLGAGAPPLSMSALFVTEDPSIPIGTVQNFANAAAVSAWFGPASNQAALAAMYFSGYTGCTQLPGAMLWAQYNPAAVSAYLRGLQNTPLTLAQVQALSGTIAINVNGTNYTTGSINLSGATSFSNAASLIQTGLTAVSAPVTVTYDALRGAFLITSNTTGSGSTIAYPTDTSLSPALYLTQAKGAVLSQGAAAATASGIMTQVAAVNSNWAAFTTDWLPNDTIKLAFAAWVTLQDDEFVYVAYDNNAAALAPNASSSFGVLTALDNGVYAIYNPSGLAAAFVCGAIASINFTQPGGRTSFAYLSNPGLTPDIVSQTQMNNLLGNSYDCYVGVAAATEAFQYLWNGHVSGAWKWLDSYVNQIYFNSAFQSALLSLLTQSHWIPFNNQGAGQIGAAIQPVINQMLGFGAAVAGGTLSGSQAAEISANYGANAVSAIENAGYFVSIPIPPTTTQVARGPWSVTVLYFDGESVQTINFSSIDVE